MTCGWSIFIWWMNDMFLRNSQCKSQHIIFGVYMNLDHGCMTRISHGSQQFDKAQHDNKQHMTKVFEMCNIIWLW